MMIMKRSAVAATVFTLTLSLPTAAHAATQPATLAASATAVPQVLPTGVAVSALPIATEDRTGYQRTSSKHWNAGRHPGRRLRHPPGGPPGRSGRVPGDRLGLHPDRRVWWSYYDEREITPAGALDIDYMVSAPTTL
ncbi:hypothetical protein AB0D66_26910 [Streptomyces sp. NPDC048270]|uniref:hypothetical protein n=1 Tax=Streptomyces sp. NPDC048270 TaxID=3154615 RepID=UPI0033DEFEED